MQSGKATAVFGPSKDRDIVSEGGKCGSTVVEIALGRTNCGQVIFLLLYEQSRVRVVAISVFFGLLQQETSK